MGGPTVEEDGDVCETNPKEWPDDCDMNNQPKSGEDEEDKKTKQAR
jgi:hypothetical protein